MNMWIISSEKVEGKSFGSDLGTHIQRNILDHWLH